jgi:hypothetical protein
MIPIRHKIFFSLLCFILVSLRAQEFIRPLNSNINCIYPDLRKNGSHSISRQNKTAAASLSLPFLDDFYYATLQSYADTNLWSGKSAYVNTSHGIAPPSIGVATFDGLNFKGYPHNPGLTNMSQSLAADTLTSKAINLYTRNTLTLQPSDSVSLTFYYQARGFGDWPELTDSLLVDFYMPFAPIYTINPNNHDSTIVGYGQWQKVWWHRGNPDANTNDTIFKRAYIPIVDTAYFHDGFKFRFRNKATTAGDFDQWHVDYVFLDFHRAITDTAYDDISIGYVPTPLLARYSAMPWEQYVSGERANYQSVFIRNNNNLDVPNMSYESRMYDNLGAPTYSYNGGAINNLRPFRSNGWSNAAPHAHPAFTYTFNAPFTDSADFKMVHYIYRSGSGDFITNNDTVVQYQRFRNYFAFDDGSAEAAYYINGSSVQIVERITLNVADTLRAVRIYFDPVGNITQAASSYSFQLVVYADGGSGLPGIQLYKDSLVLPKYLQAGPNVAPEYTLTTPQVYGPGDYYVGIKQKTANIDIGIGFDRNLDHSQNVFFQNGGAWTQSGIRGSLFMRPVFGRKILSPTAGLHELNSQPAIGAALIYPNPASNMLYINCKSESKLSYEIMNLMGQVLAQEPLEKNAHEINTATLSEGIYLIVLKSDKQIVQSQRIIIQR